ncbi:probable N-acetyltransferase CML1 [Amblyraja radiata]|uniref:probable N-acetyltransferase CML1 n=1 Tax=Amblyraja radiata TaxID=386614 RepID=UPI001403B948|nr:probable N-acetyltransferase CML1 [Amblyraja radiata]
MSPLTCLTHTPPLPLVEAPPPPHSGSLDHGSRLQGRRGSPLHSAPVPGRRLAGGLQDILGGSAGPAFRRALLSPSAPCLLLAAGVAVYGAGWQLAWVALTVAALLALLYLACRQIYAEYVKQQLEADMADIERAYVGKPGAGFWTVEEEGGGGGLRGVVAAQEAEAQPGCCQLLRLSIDRRCRGRGLGLGRRLTRRVLEFARDSGYRECVLNTSTAQQPAIRLYLAQGFRVTKDAEPIPGLALLSWVTNIYVCELRLGLLCADLSWDQHLDVMTKNVSKHLNVLG